MTKKRKPATAVAVYTHIATIHRERGKERGSTLQLSAWCNRNVAQGRPALLGRPMGAVVPGVPYTGPREKAPHFNRQALSDSERVVTDLAAVRGLSLAEVLRDPELLFSPAAVQPPRATGHRQLYQAGGHTAVKKEEGEEEEEEEDDEGEERVIKRARVTPRPMLEQLRRYPVE